MTNGGIGGTGPDPTKEMPFMEFEFTWPDGHKERIDESKMRSITDILMTGAVLTGVFIKGQRLSPPPEDT